MKITMMSRQVGSQAAEEAYSGYSLTPRRMFEPTKGYRNHSYPAELSDGTMANLIVYKDEPKILLRIKLANRASDFLASQGLPVRRTLDQRILQIQTGLKTRYASLYTYLPGNTIPWEGYTSEHIKLLGQAMARMHDLLANFAASSLPSVETEYQAIIHRMQRYFTSNDVRLAIKQKLNLKVETQKLAYYSDILDVCKRLRGRQALHMDFVRSNVLFDENAEKDTAISGILDFEKVAYGSRIFDIARTLAFLYVDCKYKDVSKVHRCFLISGYIRRGHLDFNDTKIINNGQKVALLEVLMEMFWLYDFYKFLKHNPYEQLNQNEHFVRVRSLLLDRKLTASTK